MGEKLTTEQAAALVKKLEELTSRTAFRLAVNAGRVPALCDTKFGGVPYWDSRQEYPDLLGSKMVLLAQINLGDLGRNEYLPDHGILQFFILPDDMYGCDFESPDANDTFRVVYHADIDSAVTVEDVLAMDIPTTLTAERDESWLPIWGKGEVAVDVQKTTVSMGVECYEYDELLAKAAAELGISLPKHFTSYSLLPNDLFESECSKNAGHWLFGYPYFTQTDPRGYKEELSRYDTLLFQMDSDYPAGRDYQIMWGDSGVANFFISRDDLEKLDFSKVMYTWDCC